MENEKRELVCVFVFCRSSNVRQDGEVSANDVYGTEPFHGDSSAGLMKVIVAGIIVLVLVLSLVVAMVWYGKFGVPKGHVMVMAEEPDDEEEEQQQEETDILELGETRKLN